MNNQNDFCRLHLPLTQYTSPWDLLFSWWLTSWWQPTLAQFHPLPECYHGCMASQSKTWQEEREQRSVREHCLFTRFHHLVIGKTKERRWKLSNFDFSGIHTAPMLPVNSGMTFYSTIYLFIIAKWKVSSGLTTMTAQSVLNRNSDL